MGTQTRFCTIVPAITWSRKDTCKNKQKLKQILTLHTYIHTHTHTQSQTLTAMRMHSRPYTLHDAT